MRVLIAQAEAQLAPRRAEELLMDGHDSLLGPTARATRLKLAELPDTVLLLLDGSEAPAATITLLRELRSGAIAGADSRVPVHVLASAREADHIRYYQAGADALLPATASPLLIAAALQALHRRAGAPEPHQAKVGTVAIDLDARTVHVNQHQVALTRLEYDLLRTLASRLGRTFTRAELTREVWGYDPTAVGPSRTIDPTAHRLSAQTPGRWRRAAHAQRPRGRLGDRRLSARSERLPSEAPAGCLHPPGRQPRRVAYAPAPGAGRSPLPASSANVTSGAALAQHRRPHQPQRLTRRHGHAVERHAPLPAATHPPTAHPMQRVGGPLVEQILPGHPTKRRQ